MRFHNFWMRAKAPNNPIISHPTPGTFTPNSPERYTDPLNTYSTKRTGLKGWIKSRSRLFWVILAFSVLLVVGLTISLPLFFLTKPRPSQPFQILFQSLPQGSDQVTVVPHSFLVDINTADDEPTRVAVNTL